MNVTGLRIGGERDGERTDNNPPTKEIIGKKRPRP